MTEKLKTMKHVKVPGTDLDISVVTLGSWVFGGQMWGGSVEKDCVEAVQAALDAGVNIIDTAPIYGNGLSEKIIGKAIHGKRDQVILATKCGLIEKNTSVISDLTAASIQKELELSLKRLKTDHIDLYQCHWPDPVTSLEETFTALTKLQKEGKIRHIGVSNFDIALLKKAIKLARIVTVQMPYSFLDRSIEKDILPFCREQGIGVLTYGALGGGILTGKYASPTHFPGADARNFFYKFYEGQVFEQVSHLVTELRSHKKPPSQTAINWVRQQPGVTSVIVGCRNALQATDNIGAIEWDLSPEDLGSLGSSQIPAVS